MCVVVVVFCLGFFGGVCVFWVFFFFFFNQRIKELNYNKHKNNNENHHKYNIVPVHRWVDSLLG